MERRRRIRDLSHGGERWIASVVAEAREDGVWRGCLVFFRDDPEQDVRLEDRLPFQALAFDEIVAQATALSLAEVQGRLVRAQAREAV